MAVLRIVVFLFVFMCGSISRALCLDSIPKYTLGCNLSQPIVGAFKRDISSEFVIRRHFENSFVQFSFGYNKLNLRLPYNQSLYVPTHLNENEFNKIDGFHYRLGVFKKFELKFLHVKYPFQSSLGINFNYVNYRHMIKLKYRGYYIDEIYYYDFYKGSKFIVEPEFNIVLLSTFNKKLKIELNNRVGINLFHKSDNALLYKVPAQNHLTENVICYSLLNVVMHFQM